MSRRDYYQVPGVSRGAAGKEIKNAYRHLVRQYHPEVNPGNKSAEAKFKEINQAYEILSDSQKWKQYNQFSEQWEHAEQFARGVWRLRSP